MGRTKGTMADQDQATSSTARPTGPEDRGIPEAEFIEDLASYLKKYDGNSDSALKQLNEMYGKYKFLESNMIGQKAALLHKLPDIITTLTIVKKLQKTQDEGEALKSRYLLSDNCFANADIDPDNTVCLWLGANIMVEYSYAEAISLLEEQKVNCETSLEELTESCLFVRDQITTTEVNIARVYNFDVLQRRQAREHGTVDQQ
eukprot:c17572_g1_i1.p1 GENE.c17572_g1_i1~~c17572_g1_i1.p1  ORF type:complete len:203 (+),score=59.23 c17572_g1_i1:1-609(+)